MQPPDIPGLSGAGLTPRETQVVHLILARFTNLAIAVELECSVKNVEALVSNIFRKTHTTSRLDLVMKIMSARRHEGDDGGPPPEPPEE